MENPEQAADVLKVLRGSGVELALDDFGTGYSSLAYLNRFPFDTIKISRELVRSSGSASGAAIMRSMVALAHELSKTVVAEGVERADEATFLRSIGCEYAQGYHFGEPIPDRAVMQLLKVVRRSERKMQPRGFFRPKQKTAVQDVAAKPSRAVAANGGTAKAALPAGAVVRQRQKAISDKGRVNGAANILASLSAAEKSPATILQNAVTTGSPPPPPPPMLAPPRPHRQPQKSATMAKPLSPPRPAANIHNFARPSLPKPGPEPTLDGLQPSIVTPLAEALERASAQPVPVLPLPPQPQLAPASMPPSAPPLRNGSPAIAAGEPPPLPVGDVPTTKPPVTRSPSAMPPSTQPDFSSLPPSIAASLARLAGGVLVVKTEGKGADSDTPRTEPKIASNAGSGGA